MESSKIARIVFCAFYAVSLCLVLSFTSFSQTKTKIPTIDTRICSDCYSGKPVMLAKPKYPASARRAKLTGRVSIVVTINPLGKVVKAKVSTGEKVFWPNAERAALRSRFQPPQFLGKPVSIVTVISYDFVLDSSTNVEVRENGLNEELKPKLPIVNATAYYFPRPVFPKLPVDVCANGKVSVQVLIGKNGRVKKALAIEGNKLLRNSAVNAAKLAKFRQHDDMPPREIKGIVVYNVPPSTGCSK